MVGRIGIPFPATSPNEQAFVCSACLPYQRPRSPGELTSQMQKLFSAVIYNYTEILPRNRFRGKVQGFSHLSAQSTC